jgi:hypothetical protein
MSTQNKLVACFLALCVPGFSQSPALPHGKSGWNNVTALARAAEVQVNLSGSRIVRGGVLNVTEDSLAVNSATGEETFTRQQVLRVSVRKPSRRGRNALIGLGIGAGAGVGIGAASVSKSCPGLGSFPCSPGLEAMAVGVGIFTGAGVGAVIGALIPTGGWREVYRQ